MSMIDDEVYHSEQNMALLCADCDEPATRTFDEGSEYAYWTGKQRHTPVCDQCFRDRDNREPKEYSA